jgi:diazepam-binding inhibitor (GABA receptor modulator, acyl-CoA-binding protein)
MSDLKRRFDVAAADSKNLSEALGNDMKLKLYGLFKQAGAGDVTGSRPGFADIVGRAKYDAWAAVKGTHTEDAMQQYIDLVESLKLGRTTKTNDPVDSVKGVTTPVDDRERERRRALVRAHYTAGNDHDSLNVVMGRLSACYSGTECAWESFYKPQSERANFATRYHLVYPGLAYYALIRRQPDLAPTLRPQLDTMYRGLLEPRTWSYWHRELGETSWPLRERNLTYAGRLATFIGFYIDAFGAPPAPSIELDGRSITYHELSEGLVQQAANSPSGGVTCYSHRAMTMCNAHLLINNVLHDRLYGTEYRSTNNLWLRTLETHLTRPEKEGPLFFFATQSNSCCADDGLSLGVDAWTLFLMSSVVPDRVAKWFPDWRKNIKVNEDRAYVEIPQKHRDIEFSSTELASAWAYCLAKELGHSRLAWQLRRTLEPQVESGFKLDPLISGLFLLGDVLEKGSFNALVATGRPSPGQQMS